MVTSQLKVLVLLLCMEEALSNVADGRPTAVLSAPLATNSYYADRYEDILDFQVSYGNILLTNGVNVVISCDQSTCDKLRNKGAPSDTLWKAGIEDIWMRDFTRVNPNIQTGFRFKPSYMSNADARAIRKSFDTAVTNAGLSFTGRNSYILDGGNVVDNFVDMAVVGDRFMEENGLYGVVNTQNILKYELDYQDVSIIPSIEGDTTGHSDGVVSFIDQDVIAYSALDDQTYDTMGNLAIDSMVEALEADFGNKVKLVSVPYTYPTGAPYKDFTSACGSHVNALYTGSKLFVPTFGGDAANAHSGLTAALDDEVVGIIEANTNAEVYRVPVPKKVCETGGNVRCLTWLVSGSEANTLVNYVKSQSK